MNSYTDTQIYIYIYIYILYTYITYITYIYNTLANKKTNQTRKYDYLITGFFRSAFLFLVGN